jgi:hypothetical protein
MKKAVLLFFAVVFGFISCFGCNTGGKNIQPIISNGIELAIEIGEHWQGKMKGAPREGRPEALPVWNHKRQNSFEQIDIVSSATPKGTVDIQIDNGSLTNGHEYNVYKDADIGISQ